MKTIGIMLLALAIAMLTFAAFVVGDPTGGVLTPGNSSRGVDPSATTQAAQAGNVTQLNIDQTRITTIWQGFYGNVSGQIVLENSAGDNFYDWTQATTLGQVYGTRLAIASWADINCTNSTQWETEENALNIPSTATDGINETFTGTTHPTFSVGAKTIPVDYCKSTRPYNSTGLPGDFYNVLLNSNNTNTVYTAVLADNRNGFDDTTVDFEILVPTDRSTGTATYYFYVELQ
ncbi:MAG: hypothetical protein ABIJ34_01725 [archaeon]